MKGSWRNRKPASSASIPEWSSTQLVERFDLEVERLVGGAAAAVGRDGDAVGFAAGAGDLDRAGVRGGVGVDFEAAEGAGVLAAEGDHPAEVLALLAFALSAGSGRHGRHLIPSSSSPPPWDSGKGNDRGGEMA